MCKPLARLPVLTYASFNLHNWRRIDPSLPIELGNTQRALNFLGGQDEEWFSAVSAMQCRAPRPSMPHRQHRLTIGAECG